MIGKSFEKCWILDPTDQGLGNILTLDCIPVLVGNLILWALIFAGVAALIFIIFSGIKFITSGGDPKQVEGARKTLTFAIAGLVLILLSFAILRFIADVTNLGCIREFGFTTCEGKIKVIEPDRPHIKSTNYNRVGDEGSFDSLNCIPVISKKVCKPGGGMCGCVPQNWPKCNSPLDICGPGYICNINEKTCRPS